MDAPNAIFSKVTPGTMNSVKLKENQTACYSLQMEIATGAREDQFLLTESVWNVDSDACHVTKMI